MSDPESLSAVLRRPLKETMNDPKMQWTRVPRNRRLLVLSFLALIVAIPLVTLSLDPVYALGGGLPFFVILAGCLNLSTRGLTELRQSRLDEREGRVRDAAYRTVYWPGIVLGAASAAALGLAIADSSTPWLFGLAFSLWSLALSLPTLLLAWTLPAEHGDES